jgi:hypothetical protein
MMMMIYGIPHLKLNSQKEEGNKNKTKNAWMKHKAHLNSNQLDGNNGCEAQFGA